MSRVGDPKQHHYVPRFYLQRFTDAQGHVWAFDKSTDKVFCSAPTKLAREAAFYEAPGLGAAIDQAAMEGMLSDLERAASQVVARWMTMLPGPKPGALIVEEAD